ncbi:hypothetical protein HV824_10715 [Myxococcus sp. AM009]|uniref:hypothetical protein n=1 Tax=Myxococcus sp. AM009 TaxID=2745137 RepID=UPI00159593C8|nr:hypothetical protein [Myxococcus sp. AM009]NVI98589.1 hypothetical protein [Myxococcus sp. AM009]
MFSMRTSTWYSRWVTRRSLPTRTTDVAEVGEGAKSSTVRLEELPYPADEKPEMPRSALATPQPSQGVPGAAASPFVGR